MNNLDEKVDLAQHLVRRVLQKYKNPVVMSSFGKDSMVMLHMIKEMGLKFPILFHKQHIMPKKLRFANSIIDAENYSVFDYPPSAVTFLEKHGYVGFVQWYSVGEKYMQVLLDVNEPSASDPVVCGYKEIYQKPMVPAYDFPWDLAFMGHKATDTDRIYKNIPLDVDMKVNVRGPDYLFPLRHFTDKDIWDYTTANELPINHLRYNAKKEFQEFDDVTFNNDKYSVCTSCMDRRKPGSVFCPLIQSQITNISSEIRYTEPEERPEYIRDHSQNESTLVQ